MRGIRPEYRRLMETRVSTEPGRPPNPAQDGPAVADDPQGPPTPENAATEPVRRARPRHGSFRQSLSVGEVREDLRRAFGPTKAERAPRLYFTWCTAPRSGGIAQLVEGQTAAVRFTNGDVLVGVVERIGERAIVFRPWSRPADRVPFAAIVGARPIGEHRWQEQAVVSRRQRQGLSAYDPKEPKPPAENTDAGE